MELIDKIKQELKESLSEKRYIHSLGTMERAEELAKIYGVDVEKARLDKIYGNAEIKAMITAFGTGIHEKVCNTLKNII